MSNDAHAARGTDHVFLAYDICWQDTNFLRPSTLLGDGVFAGSQIRGSLRTHMTFLAASFEWNSLPLQSQPMALVFLV
jgi:hypothetical protein